jgi:hypothetical protein
MTSNIVEMKAQSRALSNGILNPENLHEALEMATVLSKSSLIPKDFQGNPGNVLVAIQWGMELGLAPMQALQSIAVINGRPSLWGDAVIALCKSHPICEWVRETFDEDGTAVCTTQRRGDPEPVERRFSMADATKAGLSSKTGPWTQYPRRMLQMRARSWCLRDAYPDLLRGMAVADEEQDRVIISEAPPVTALPEGASKTEKVKAKLAALNAPAIPVAALPTGEQVNTETGEVMDPIADLLLAISECQSREDLEAHRAAVAGLKDGQKRRAVNAWKAVEARLPE